MSCKKVEGLPFMPGNIYADPTIADYRKTQIFDYINGFPVPKAEYNGIGGEPLEAKCTVKDLFGVGNYDPILTYGKPKERPLPPFIPAFVALEKKCLEFMAYYKETVNDSNQENYRVRHVRIHYYLEDDSMMIDEPRVENSGLMQGKFLRRHRIPKSCVGESYHWKDLNISCDLMIYGRVFRIYDCNEWTKLFFESEGLILNDPEDSPRDPYIDKRIQASHVAFNCSKDLLDDKRKRYFEFGNKTLHFLCIWDDRENLYGTLRKMELAFFLSDRTVQITEPLEPNSGRDPYKVFLYKIKLPKNYKDLPIIFPTISLEPDVSERVEYYDVDDFKIGATINVFGRRFLIYDMNECTRKFYRDNFGYTDFTPICIPTEDVTPIKADGREQQQQSCNDSQQQQEPCSGSQQQRYSCQQGGSQLQACFGDQQQDDYPDEGQQQLQEATEAQMKNEYAARLCQRYPEFLEDREECEVYTPEVYLRTPPPPCMTHDDFN